MQGHITWSISERIRGSCSISVKTELQPAHSVKANVPTAAEPMDHYQVNLEHRKTHRCLTLSVPRHFWNAAYCHMWSRLFQTFNHNERGI